MKRKTLKFFACAAIMAMTLSVTACGGSNKDDNATGTEAPQDDKAADAADDKAADAADDKAADAADDKAADAADDKAADAADDKAADAADNTETDAADAADATGATLEEMLNDPAAKATFDSMTQSMTQQGMSASVSAVGNELIMEVKIEDSSLITDGIGETLGAALDSQAEMLKTQVKTLDSAVGQEGACTYTVRYLDPDGNLLVEKSFKAE